MSEQKMIHTMEELSRALREGASEDYRAFFLPLIPAVDPGRVLGVSLPALDEIIKRMSPEFTRTFLDSSSLPHGTHEEDLLHMRLLRREGDFAAIVANLKYFLPHVDSWAVTDTPLPKVFREHRRELWPTTVDWLGAQGAYTRRYALYLLKSLYLDQEYGKLTIQIVGAFRDPRYYVAMMQAWFFQEAFLHFEEESFAVYGQLPEEVQRMTRRKVLDSKKSSPQLKSKLRRPKS
ncbi:MAG: DNA alkylation repair protein [Tissierellia bacterium]|nr:DNA alkylation repair protein [Tissierellia bacterium]